MSGKPVSPTGYAQAVLSSTELASGQNAFRMQLNRSIEDPLSHTAAAKPLLVHNTKNAHNRKT